MTVDSITDFTPWDLRDHFSDDEAAYLWLGLEPSYSNDHPSKVISMRFTLGEAEKRGELTNQTPYRSAPGRVICIPVTRYSRQDLRQYAEHHGQRPPFLFPEYRQPPNTENTGSLPPKPEPATTSPVEAHETLPARAKSTLLKILDAALSQYYGQDWLDGDIPTCVSKWTKDLEFSGIEIPAECRSLTRWFNRMAEKRRQ